MCIIFFAYKSHPDYRLIVAANRDEFYARPTERAHFWEDEPNVLAGRDLEQMGTWLGMATDGKFAALTNVRNPNPRDPSKQSRGQIIRDFLTGEETPEQFLRQLDKNPSNYEGFNVLTADDDSLFYYSNVENNIKQLEPGIYGLSNDRLDTPWPKVEKGKKQLQQLLTSKTILKEADLFQLLRDNECVPVDQRPDTGMDEFWEERLSAIFIETPTYGTRCSTVLTIDNDGEVRFTERTFPIQEPKDQHFQFQLQ